MLKIESIYHHLELGMRNPIQEEALMLTHGCYKIRQKDLIPLSILKDGDYFTSICF